MNQRLKLFLTVSISIVVLYSASFGYPIPKALPPEPGYITGMKLNKRKLRRIEPTLTNQKGNPALAERYKDLPPVHNFVLDWEAQKGKLQGGAVAILYKGEVIYKTVFGYEKEDNSRAITTHTLFSIASLAKPISALAVALLVEQRKLHFNDRFELPHLKHLVSLKNILGHTTGYQFSGNTQIEEGVERSVLLQKIGLQRPQGQVGMYYSYSNTMFSLLAEALEAKKMSLTSVLKELKKALQTNEITRWPIEEAQPVAYRHLPQEIGGQTFFKSLPLPSYYEKATPAAAGIFASLEAMIKVFQASFGYKPKLISAKTLDKLYRTHIANRDIERWKIAWPCPINRIQSYYGLGWRILKAEDHPGQDLLFHSGYLAGAASYIGFMPSEEIGLIILLNQQSRLPLERGIRFWGDFLQ